MGAQAVRLSNGDIDNALKDKDFEVLFQPIFDLGNGALARVETFIRWRHPTLGVLPPGAFISFFETQGRMSELTRYVLAEALNAYNSWRGPHAPGFSINLALSDLSDEAFPSHFAVLLREHGFPAELVTLECPMPAVDADTDTVARQLQRLAETGARLAIEVRGRANDFLKNIRPFPFAEIKTGGAAILRFARTVRGPGLSAISELLELAAEQNAAITAVGVEDQASLSALRGLGFAAAQGNHLGKVGALAQFMPSHVNDVRALLGLEPLSSEDLSALFRTGAPRLPSAPVESPTAAEPDLIVEEALIAEAVEAAAHETPAEDELVQRLAARIARAEGKSDEEDADEERRLRAKAAAIARAKRNGKLREKLAARNALKEKAQARPDAPAPRDMQERLSREFGASADDTGIADEFEMQEAQADAPHVPASDDAEAFDPQMTENSEPETAGPGDLEPETAPSPVAATPAQSKPFNARLAVGGARARFNPPIRVSGPEPVPLDDDMGDLAREFTAEPQAVAPEQAPQREEIEDQIPEPMSTAAWLEESVEIAGEKAPSTPERRKKNFLMRTLIPYSALKVTHFWPHTIRRRMKRANKSERL